MTLAKYFILISSFTLSVSYGETKKESKVTCTQGTNKRTVTVDFADLEKNPPCKVTYYKVTEEPWKQDVLYQADTNSEFCATKAQDLVDRLVSWGWKCDGRGVTTAEITRSRTPSKSK